MKRVLKFAGTLVGIVSVSLGSVVVVLAQNSVVETKKAAPVDPYMAIISTVVIGAIGIVAFVKRNKTK